MADLEPFLRFWRALDERFERVEPLPWGAVVSDARFPRILEANYARVETADGSPRVAEIDEALRPELDRTGCERAHVVVFFPEELTDLVTEASTRGETITWDLVMAFEVPPAADDGRVEEADPREDGFWAGHRESARHFGIEEAPTLDQLQAIERDLMVPAGKRWFVVREEGEPVAYGSLIVLEGVGFIDHVVTFPTARRRGHATELTRRILTEARAAGALRTFLLAEPRGAAAAMYRRLGFRAVTHLASWITPLGRDAG